VAHLVELREIGIVVIEIGAALFEDFHDFQRGGLSQVVDILLIGDAEDQDFGAAEAFLVEVEGFGDGIDDVVGHGGVDFAGELDEAGGKSYSRAFQDR